MFHIHRRKNFFTKTNELVIARFFLAIALASIDTVWALYMDSFGLSESEIGFLSSFLVIVTLLSAFYSTQILEKLREYKVLVLSLVIYIISYLSIALTNNLLLFITFSILLTTASVFRMDSFDILFRDALDDKKLNSNEGLMYSILNIGWLVGPLIAALVIAMYDLRTVFITSTIFVAFTLLILLVLNIRQPRKKREIIDKNIFLNLKDYISDKKLSLPYFMAAGIEVWWALIYIYIPLFVINNGFKEEYVGFFLTAICVPLVLLEFPVGKLSEKKGFKWLFVFGFIFIGLSSLACFFITDMTLILIILVIASFGMAFLEPIQDSYFFRQVSSVDEEKYFPIFATAGDVGSFIGKFSIAGILLFFPENYSYALMSIFMFIFALFAIKIKN